MEIRKDARLRLHRRVAITTGAFLLLVLGVTILGMTIFSPQTGAPNRNRPGLTPSDANQKIGRTQVSSQVARNAESGSLADAEEILSELRLNERLNSLTETLEEGSEIGRLLLGESPTTTPEPETASGSTSTNSQFDERLTALADSLEEIIQETRQTETVAQATNTDTEPNPSPAQNPTNTTTDENSDEGETEDKVIFAVSENDVGWVTEVGRAAVGVWKLLWDTTRSKLQAFYEFLRGAISISISINE